VVVEEESCVVVVGWMDGWMDVVVVYHIPTMTSWRTRNHKRPNTSPVNLQKKKKQTENLPV
jgi:hypothetical protein